MGHLQIVRPVLIGSSQFRQFRPSGVYNRIQSNLPTTVDNLGSTLPPLTYVGWQKNFNSGISQAWFLKFHFPLTGPFIHTATSSASTGMLIQGAANLNGDNAYDIDGRCYIMTDEWDVNTLTWDTQPSPTVDDQFISFRIVKAANAYIDDDRFQPIQFSPTLQIFGIMTKLEIASYTPGSLVPSGPTPSVITTEMFELTNRPQRSNSIVARETDGFSVSTLTTNGVHGLTSFHIGLQIAVAGVGVGYNNAIAFITAVPSATTIKYTSSHAPEASTPCTGTISYW